MPTFLRVFGKVNFQLFYQSMDLLRRVITFLKIKTHQDFEGTPLPQQASLRTHGCVGEETWDVWGKPMPLLPAELTLSMWEIPPPLSSNPVESMFFCTFPGTFQSFLCHSRGKRPCLSLSCPPERRRQQAQCR